MSVVHENVYRHGLHTLQNRNIHIQTDRIQPGEIHGRKHTKHGFAGVFRRKSYGRIAALFCLIIFFRVHIQIISRTGSKFFKGRLFCLLIGT